MEWLVLAALASVVLWQIPWGEYVLYPFSILATWFHEMGHGITALIVGGQFDRLLIFPDGSGLARYSISLQGGGIRQALVAAGGPMGAPIAGCLLILASRRSDLTKTGLLLLSAALILSSVIWIRTMFGIAMMAVIGVAILAIAVRGSEDVQAFTVRFLGVQACVSTYRQLNYLFTKEAIIGGQLMLSDSGKIASHLLLPYWFWGSLMAAASLLLLVVSLVVACRRSAGVQLPRER